MAPFQNVFTHEADDGFVTVDMRLRCEKDGETDRRDNDEHSNKNRVATQQNQLTGNSTIFDRPINWQADEIRNRPAIFAKANR